MEIDAGPNWRAPSCLPQSTAFQLFHQRHPDRTLLLDECGRLCRRDDADRDAKLGEALLDYPALRAPDSGSRSGGG